MTRAADWASEAELTGDWLFNMSLAAENNTGSLSMRAVGHQDWGYHHLPWAEEAEEDQGKGINEPFLSEHTVSVCQLPGRHLVHRCLWFCSPVAEVSVHVPWFFSVRKTQALSFEGTLLSPLLLLQCPFQTILVLEMSCPLLWDLCWIHSCLVLRMAVTSNVKQLLLSSVHIPDAPNL